MQVESYKSHKAELKKGEALVHVAKATKTSNKMKSKAPILDNLVSVCLRRAFITKMKMGTS